MQDNRISFDLQHIMDYNDFSATMKNDKSTKEIKVTLGNEMTEEPNINSIFNN